MRGLPLTTDLVGTTPAAPTPVHFRGSRHARVAGISLIAAAILEVAAMAHHPSVGPSNVVDAIEQIKRLSSLSAVVHAALIGLMLVVACVLADFSLRRRRDNVLVRSALIA